MVEVDAAIALIGADGPVTLLDDVRGPPAADRLLPHVVPRQTRRGAVRGLHVLQRAGPRARPPALARRHLRDLLPGPVRGERPLPRLHGLGRAVVLGRRTPPTRWSPAATSACTWSATCATATGSSRPTGPPAAASRRWTPSYGLLDLTVLRPPGAVGGLARRLAAALGRRRRATYRLDGRPIAQWSRIEAGRSDDLGTAVR